MYIAQILGYLSWPFLILVSYLCVRWALKVFEKRYTAGEAFGAEAVATDTADATDAPPEG